MELSTSRGCIAVRWWWWRARHREGAAAVPRKGFLRRRLLRLAPLYLLTNLLAYPSLALKPDRDQTSRVNDVLSWVLTFTGTNTWLGVPFVINGPSWCVRHALAAVPCRVSRLVSLGYQGTVVHCNMRACAATPGKEGKQRRRQRH